MTLVWKEFPKINRKLGFQAKAQTYAATLGCHCGSISGVQLLFGTGYYSGCDGKNIEVLDVSKEKPIVWNRDRYNDYWIPPKEEAETIRKFLLEFVHSPEFMVDIYKNLIDTCSNIPLWVMSDVINSQAPARKPPEDTIGTLDRYLYLSIGSTGAFAKYLIDNKIGYILSSPIVQNPLHRSTSNYSLNQAWFWIPPKQLERAIDVVESYGEDKFPTKEQWSFVVAKDLGLGLHADSLEVCKKAFNTGVFPEDGRFKRPRMKKMKVIEHLVDEFKKGEPEPIPIVDEHHPAAKEA